jgi:1-phosphofructokinase family hexose kinase
MIQVVSLSPAIDVTYTVDKTTVGAVHRVGSVARKPGGKALNVMGILHTLSSPARLVAPLGGMTGDWVENVLRSEGVSLTRIDTSIPTRECVTVVDSSSATEFNEPAPALASSDMREITAALTPAKITILSGSISPHITRDDVRALFQALREHSEVLLIDTSGDALVVAADYADYVKPNQRELREATQSDDAIEALLLPARTLVSKAEGGATLWSDSTISARAPLQHGNPTGAGDALVAAFASRLGDGEETALRFGVAVAAASVRSATAGVVDLDVVHALLPEIEMSTDASRVD